MPGKNNNPTTSLLPLPARRSQRGRTLPLRLAVSALPSPVGSAGAGWEPGFSTEEGAKQRGAVEMGGVFGEEAGEEAPEWAPDAGTAEVAGELSLVQQIVDIPAGRAHFLPLLFFVVFLFFGFKIEITVRI